MTIDYSQHKVLEFRRKFWKFTGAEITISDPHTDQVVGFIKMKAWTLREDIRLYTDSTRVQEVFHIKARQIIDFGATYDVVDSETEQPLFSLRRRGLKSTFVRDHWDILYPSGADAGSIQETSGRLALFRRYLSFISELFDLVFMFVVQSYTIMGSDGAVAGTVIHRKNPFVVKMTLDISAAQVIVDPRLPIAATALLAIIDASKNN